MSHYDEDFYNEPSEFDQQITDFKTALAGSIKKEFNNKMESLLKENAELQTVKNDFANIQKNYVAKHNQLERDRQDMERKVNKKRLNELMSDFEIILYTARSNGVLPPKCNKCDDNRRIPYKTPSGKEVYEGCDCGVSNQVYYPEEFVCIEFGIDRNGKGLAGIYNKRDYSDDGYKSSGISTDDLYLPGTEYEKINNYRTMFRTKEDCQKYCDWRTEKEAVTNG